MRLEEIREILRKFATNVIIEAQNNLTKDKRDS